MHLALLPMSFAVGLLIGLTSLGRIARKRTWTSR